MFPSQVCKQEREWIIEGYGVDPDIEVDNDPQSLMQGKDPQLRTGHRGTHE
jgi:C-terminal processing protease CtpA/Prc